MMMWLQEPFLEESGEEVPPILLSHGLLPHELVVEQLENKSHSSNSRYRGTSIEWAESDKDTCCKRYRT